MSYLYLIDNPKIHDKLRLIMLITTVNVTTFLQEI